MGKSKNTAPLRVTLAVPTNLSFEELWGLAPSTKKRQGQDTSEQLEDLELETPDSSEELEPDENIWPSNQVFDNEVAEALVPAMMTAFDNGEAWVNFTWCLSCRRIGGDYQERYLLPLTSFLEEYHDLLSQRFDVKLDRRLVYKQGLGYKVNLDLKPLLEEISNYVFISDYAEGVIEFFQDFNKWIFEVMTEILAKHQKTLEIMPFASVSHYFLTAAPLGNAMIMEATTKEYGESNDRSLKLYALGDAPQEDDAWKMKFPDARELLDQRWLMSDVFTQAILRGVTAEVLEKFFCDDGLLVEELVGTALEGSERVMMIPVIWLCEKRTVKVTYGIVGECGWQLDSDGEMVQADLGGFTLWYCPGRSTDAIMTKKGGDEV